MSQKLRLSFSSRLKGLRKRASEIANSKGLVFYASVAIAFSFVSFLTPHQFQVYLSIAAGFVIVLLLPISTILSRGFKLLDMVFVAGILFLVVSLLADRHLPTRVALGEIMNPRDLRHLSFILSVALTGLHVVLDVLQSSRVRSYARSVKPLSVFFSVVNTTLSSEWCSCLHPPVLLELFGLEALLQNQVRIGFVLMMITLVQQVRSTYGVLRMRKISEQLTRT